MITNFSIFEKSAWTDTILIVDVQADFAKCFNDKYIEELFKHCELFSEVYQIYDINGDKNPTFHFPNELKALTKEYGGEIQVENGDSYFYGEVLEDFTNSLNNIDNIMPGKHWQMNSGDYYFYIGGSNNGMGHDWFICSEELFNFFISLKNRNKTLEVVGGAENECLLDITVILNSLQIKYQENKQFIFSHKGCSF